MAQVYPHCQSSYVPQIYIKINLFFFRYVSACSWFSFIAQVARQTRKATNSIICSNGVMSCSGHLLKGRVGSL